MSAQIISICLYLFGKIYEDPFVEVNRDKTTVMMSIFQEDFIGDLDLKTRSTI